MAYWEIENPAEALDLTMKFVCVRKEVQLNLAQLKGEGRDPAQTFSVFKSPDALVIVDAEIKQLSKQITEGKTDSLSKARR